MDTLHTDNGKGGGERRFDQAQYDFLKECSDKKEEGIKEWNEWREKNPETDILLEGAILTIILPVFGTSG